MEHWFGYETGMHWCESQSGAKYLTVPFIAEFTNTVSNLPLVLLPLLNLVQLRPYISTVNPLIIWPHALLALNGIASAYYHATLSLFGQLVDELLILWLVNTCAIAYLPTFNSALPQKLRPHVQPLRFALLSLSAIVSALCFLKPSLNAFALMTFSLPGILVVYLEGTRSGIAGTEHFTWRVFLLWSTALLCWVCDRVLCEIWLQLGTPYFHAIWHLLSSLAAYNVFLLFSILDIKRRALAGQHRFTVQVRHFPKQSRFGALAFPYLTLMEEAEAKKTILYSRAG